MRLRFGDKLAAAFLLLLLVTLVPVLYLVNTSIAAVSRAKILEDLEATRRVFERYQNEVLTGFADQAATLVLTQPELRAEMASVSEETEALFESILGGDTEAPIGDVSKAQPTAVAPADPGAQQLRLLSILQEVPLYQRSDVFFLADRRGRLLFSKAEPDAAGDTLESVAGIRAALSGYPTFTWWGTEALPSGVLLPQRRGLPELYQVLLQPVRFGPEVKGVIGLGFRVGPRDLEALAGITRAEVAFLSRGRIYLNSRPAVQAAALLALGKLAEQGAADQTILTFESEGESYLALSVPVGNPAEGLVGQVVVYRSQTEERRVFDSLRTTLNVVGLVAALMAAVLAFGASRRIAGVVRALSDGVGQIRGGNLEHRLQVRSRDEFGELGAAFNEMTQGLQERQRLHDAFSRYVSSPVLDELLQSGQRVQLGGEVRTVTVQFSDILGFTSLSEAMPAQDVVAFLNTYLSAMSREVERHQGVVDKYLGDGMMSFWGAPVANERHADDACLAALGQFESLMALREASSGALSRLGMGIGIHTGEVVVGNIGSESRMNYTLVGDSVNTASRMEGLNRLYGTAILISDATQAILGPSLVTREVDRVRPAGKVETVGVIELVGKRGLVPEAALAGHARYAQALALYRERRFEAAARAFREVLATYRDPAAMAMAERCDMFVREPPPDSWDGAHSLTGK